MKVRSLSILSTLLVARAVAEREIYNPETVRSLLKSKYAQQRRLGDDDDAYDEEFSQAGIEEVEAALVDYSLKLLKCEAEESLGANEDGDLTYGVAIVRACPQNSCKSSTQGGCTSGHADFALPLSDFVLGYYYDGNLQDDSIAQYSQCSAYGNYYVGPACTKDGKDVQLALFSDAYCSQRATDTTFESLSGGESLPYSSGGLVSYDCLECDEYGDDGSYGLKEMCATIYEDAALHCEEWDIQHYYWDGITEVYRFGKDTTGCKRIAWMDKTPEPFSEWASIFALAVLVVGSIAGAVWYTLWWKKRKYQS